MKLTVLELASLVGGEVLGDSSRFVTGAAFIDEAREGDVVLASDARFFDSAAGSDAACIISAQKCAKEVDGKGVIAVANPDIAYAKALGAFAPDISLAEPGIGPGAVIEPGAVVSPSAKIGPNCVIKRGAKVGDRTILVAGVFVGEGSEIGADCVLHPNVTVYHQCKIRDRVVLHAGVVIGADGFGYVPGDGGIVKLPHIGGVEIFEEVEIGANSAVDRAKTGATIIGRGTKIDNFVHIAHNCRIGAFCVFAGMSGVAGSTVIGDGVTVAAQVGIRDHVKIASGTMVAGKAGVTNDVTEKMVVSGFPAREHREEMRYQAALRRVPELLDRIKVLEKELEGINIKQ